MLKIFASIFAIANIITVAQAMQNGLPQLPSIAQNPDSNMIPAPSPSFPERQNNQFPLRNTDFPPAPPISDPAVGNSLNSMQMFPDEPNTMNMPRPQNSISLPNLPVTPEVGRVDELSTMTPVQTNAQAQVGPNNSSPCEETILKVLNRLLSEQGGPTENVRSMPPMASPEGPKIIPLPNGMLVETYIFIPNENLPTR